MSSESSVKLIENWRERWEPVDGYKVIAVADTPDGPKAWTVDSYGVLRTYGGILQCMYNTAPPSLASGCRWNSVSSAGWRSDDHEKT